MCFWLFVCFIASVDCIVQMREGGKFSQCKLREFSSWTAQLSALRKNCQVQQI